MECPARVAFLFVDGLGLTDAAESPLRDPRLETLHALTGGFSRAPFDAPGRAYRVLDATLGVDGLPQSGTGQTTLLTGVNASALLARHQGPHPAGRLRELLAEESLHVWATRRGLSVFHANGYRAEYLRRILGARRNMLSAFAVAARAAGCPLLDVTDARAHWPAYWADPDEAGRRFADAAASHHFTVLEHWALDYAGHRERHTVGDRLHDLDRFVAGYLSAAPGVTLVITSDHGNAEEPWHHTHSRNPVPFIAAGPAAATVPDSLGSLTAVAPWLRGVLGGNP